MNKTKNSVRYLAIFLDFGFNYKNTKTEESEIHVPDMGEMFLQIPANESDSWSPLVIWNRGDLTPTTNIFLTAATSYVGDKAAVFEGAAYKTL